MKATIIKIIGKINHSELRVCYDFETCIQMDKKGFKIIYFFDSCLPDYMLIKPIPQ